MGSPAIFSGKFTKLLTQLGLMLSNGAVINNDGEKNYIGYATFENGATTGWSLGTTGTLTNGIPTGTPTFGSGASGTLAISAQSTGALSGSYSLQMADSAATTAGNMVATAALPIDLAGQARVLTWEFYYKCSANAANGNFSGTSSNTFGVAAYDVTNSAWLPVCGNFNIIQSAGVGYSTGTLQTGSTTASIRFVIYCANASSGAITMLFDDFYFGPITAPTGSATTDWQSFTPTGTWTANTTYTGRWRRVGDSAEIQYNLALTGAPTATGLSLNLPSGMTIDTTKIVSAAFPNILGTAGASRSSGGTNLFPYYNGTTLFALAYQAGTGTYGQVTQALPSAWASGDSIATTITVPIAGWSSNVQMSSDTDTRVVSASYGLTSAQAVGLNAVLKYDTKVIDTHAAYSTVTGLFTAPVTGTYAVIVNWNGSVGGGTYLLKNGAGAGYVGTANANSYISGSQTIQLNAGDTLGVYADTARTYAASSTNGYINSVSINRLSGPATIAATETVACRYSIAAASMGTYPTSTNVVGTATKTFDTHAAYNGATGTFTAPITGYYKIWAKLDRVAPGAATSTFTYVGYKKNSGTEIELYNVYGNGATNSARMGGGDLVQLNAGDTINIVSVADVSSQTCQGYISFNLVK